MDFGFQSFSNEAALGEPSGRFVIGGHQSQQ
jgi:hypothetical protein